ncbi:MAG: LysM peptidoglycan-binding domain-containing protein [Verrucomicrobiae bacterium]|nr:LysM peptidoglycan-binding domain-containing protein [Verrucomicrobiae bacterium]
MVRQREDLRALREKLGQFSNDVRAAQEDASSVKGDIARLKTENESLKKEIVRLDGWIQKLDTAREQDRKAIVEEVSKEVATLRKSASAGSPKAAPASRASKPVSEDAYEHVVRKGEYLAAIAEAYGVTVAQIKKTNQLKSNELKTGQRLLIPIKEASAASKPSLDAGKKAKK